MIVLESLWDTEVYPWQADWYRARVKAALGDSTDNQFRVWFTDHANHADFVNPGDPTHIVSYLGVLQQGLRDLSLWVEKGVAPLANTTYSVVDDQVEVPATASARKGIQPVIDLTVNGGKRAEVRVSKPVTFMARVEVPPHAGKVVSAAWDLDGAGTFPVAGKLTGGQTNSPETVQATHIFTKPGTYFPTVRAASQRQGDAKTPYARIQNLDRVRVVVK